MRRPRAGMAASMPCGTRRARKASPGSPRPSVARTLHPPRAQGVAGTGQVRDQAGPRRGRPGCGRGRDPPFLGRARSLHAHACPRSRHPAQRGHEPTAARCATHAYARTNLHKRLDAAPWGVGHQRGTDAVVSAVTPPSMTQWFGCQGRAQGDKFGSQGAPVLNCASRQQGPLCCF